MPACRSGQLRVGNDIVDLTHPGLREALAGKATLRRVFASDELRLIGEAGPDSRLRWVLWAAKESAYKVARKCDPAVAFVPRRFNVSLRGRRRRHLLGWVVLEGHREFPFVAEVQTHFIHAVALSRRPEGQAVWSGVDRVASDADLSAEVRAFARHRLSGLVGGCTSEFEFARSGRVPLLLRNGRRVPVDLSFSHHGRYVAFTAVATGLVDLSA